SAPAASALSKRSGREPGTKSSERAVRDMGCSWCRELQIRGVEIRPDGDDRAADPPWQIPGGICHGRRAYEGAGWATHGGAGRNGAGTALRKRVDPTRYRPARASCSRLVSTRLDATYLQLTTLPEEPTDDRRVS